MCLICSVPFSHGLPDTSRPVTCSLLFTNPRVLISLARPWLEWWCRSLHCVVSMSGAWPGQGERAKGASNALVCRGGCVLISGAEDHFKMSRIRRAAGPLHKESRAAHITLWEGQSWVLVSMMGAITGRISAVRWLWFFLSYHSNIAAFHGLRVRLSTALSSRLSTHIRRREAGMLPALLHGPSWC